MVAVFVPLAHAIDKRGQGYPTDRLIVIKKQEFSWRSAI